MADDSGCAICEWLEGEPPGGWVVETEHWRAGVFPGFDVPGWLFLGMRRHAEGPMAMDGDEAATYGPTVARLTGAVQEATGAPRVYVIAYGELYPHWHCLVSPRGEDVPPDQRGPALFTARGALADAEGSASMAAEIAERWRARSG